MTKLEVRLMRLVRDFAVWLAYHTKSFQVWACRQYIIATMDEREKRDD